jgi:uncharacterized protein (DUF433 family)
MDTIIQVSPETYKLLKRRADEAHSTPDKLAETAIRLQLGNTVHIEQKQTASGPEAHIRGTRVAVRHIAEFLLAGHTVEEIIKEGLPHLPPAAIYEAIAYYHDHKKEIDDEIAANEREAVLGEIREGLTPEQFARLTGLSK